MRCKVSLGIGTTRRPNLKMSGEKKLHPTKYQSLAFHEILSNLWDDFLSNKKPHWSTTKKTQETPIGQYMGCGVSNIGQQEQLQICWFKSFGIRYPKLGSNFSLVISYKRGKTPQKKGQRQNPPPKPSAGPWDPRHGPANWKFSQQKLPKIFAPQKRRGSSSKHNFFRGPILLKLRGIFSF